MADKLFKIPNALEYKGDSKNWKKFKQQFDIYMKAASLEKNDSENKVNVFLNIAGEEALEIFDNLNLTSEERKDYDIVIQAFDNHCMSKENEIYKRFKFFTRAQQSSEFFSEFYDDLLVMASFCNFGTQKDRLVRDRIIAGIRSPGLQQKFLTSPDLTLEEVVNICMDHELVNMNNGILKSENGGVILEEDNTDNESNNNYDELTNVVSDALDQIHIPNEILFNDMATQEDYGEEMNFSEQSEIEIPDVKPTNVTDHNNIKSYSKRKKVPKILKSNEIEHESSEESMEFEKSTILEKLLEIPTSGRQTRSSQKQKKETDIQIKIAEVKRKLSKAIKTEAKDKQIGVTRKITRSKFKKGCSDESEESILKYYEVPVEDQEEYSQIVVQDPESSVQDNGVEMEIQTQQVVSEIENGQDEWEEENSEGMSDGVSLGMMNEMAEAEYLLEQDTNVSSPPKRKRTPKRRKNEKSTKESRLKVPEIIKVKRDNLPPLILKSVRKKTLLLGKMPYPCKKCDATFWTSFQLERHQLVHVLKKVPPPAKPPSKVFKCEECGKVFKKICDLERHTRVHTGEKPSVCNICNKRFQQSYNLNKHLYTHTQEKNFECVICQKKFGRNDVLNRHVLTHSIVKPFRCSVCSRTFIRNSQLKLHLRKHHGLDEDPGNETNTDDPVASTSTKV